VTERVSLTELTRPMFQGTNDPCLKVPAIPGGKRMPDGNEKFAPAVFILAKSGGEAELFPNFLKQRIVRGGSMLLNKKVIVVIGLVAS
jgi:hypothetical protein